MTRIPRIAGSGAPAGIDRGGWHKLTARVKSGGHLRARFSYQAART